jgi:hypothetical protein
MRSFRWKLSVTSVTVPKELILSSQNGTNRFNRALYGSNTAFRVEAGDLPEFAMYLREWEAT